MAHQVELGAAFEEGHLLVLCGEVCVGEVDIHGRIELLDTTARVQLVYPRGYTSIVSKQVHDPSRLEQEGPAFTSRTWSLSSATMSLKDEGDLIFARECAGPGVLPRSGDAFRHGQATKSQVVGAGLNRHVRREGSPLARFHNRDRRPWPRTTDPRQPQALFNRDRLHATGFRW